MSREMRGFSRNGRSILAKNDHIEPLAFDYRYTEQSNRYAARRQLRHCCSSTDAPHPARHRISTR